MTDCATGRQAGVSRLWAYFVLDQILPVSFAQNLFCTMLIVMPEKKGRQLRPAIRKRAAVSVCYILLLRLVPYTVHTTWFLPTLFALRFMLFAPFLVDRVADNGLTTDDCCTRSTIQKFNMWSLVLFSVGGLYSLPLTKEQSSEQDIAFIPNYAASALTQDMVLGVASAALFTIAN